LTSKLWEKAITEDENLNSRNVFSVYSNGVCSAKKYDNQVLGARIHAEKI
jgi:hypothetical protein